MVASAIPLDFGQSGEAFDAVIANARVIDPETETDMQANLGIRGGKIAAISRSPIRGKLDLDGTDCIACPGFIDIIAHGHDLENHRYQAKDGVTTSLQLESGAEDIAAWYAERAGRSPLNYGASAGHGHARRAVFPIEEEFEHKQATPEQILIMKTAVERNLQSGAIAVGMGIEYYPGASRWEIYEVFKVAARYNAAVHVHVRYGTVLEPGSALEGIQEVIACSAASGAPLHIVHVPSMGLRNTSQLLSMIADAQRRGFDLTADCYPYTAFGTGISSAVFDEGWQQKFAIDYGDLQWAKTGERLTKESFEKYQKEGGLVIAHAIPEAAVRAAVAHPGLMIGSDGAIRNGVGHPRGAGTFARLFGRYVREEQALPMMLAIKKVTLMPAKRMEKKCPAMKSKGRIQVGCDADITVFHPEKIVDKATFENPAQYSEGVRHVLVNGVPIVRDAEFQEGVFPGQPLRAPAA